MTISYLLLTCLLLSPWMVQFFRYVATRPEAIPTPTWMITTNVLFVFLAPLLSGLLWGESFAGQDLAASWIAFTSIAYWFTFTAVYRLFSLGQRTVLPDGPAGCETALGTLKAATLAMSIQGALLVYVPLLLIRLYFIRSWGLGVSGGGLAMLNLPYHLVVVLILFQSATGPFTAVFASLLSSRSSFAAKLLCVGPLVANFIFASLEGRRPILMFFGFVALGAIWAGRRRRILSIAGLGLAVWFILAVFSPVFLRARNLWRMPNGPDVVTAFRVAIDELGSGDRAEQLAEESAGNVRQRVNTYGFWLSFYDAFMDRPLGGLALAQAVLMNIPRFLTGLAKYQYGPTVEFLYGTPDISNNVSLESFVDLGAIGPFVHGSLLGVLFALIDHLSRRVASWNKYAAIVVVGPMIGCLVSPEQGLLGLVSVFRNTLVVAALTFLLTLAIGKRPALVGPGAPAADRGGPPWLWPPINAATR